MPLVTITVRKPSTAAFKSGVLGAIHAALVASGVPPKDQFQRVLELDAEDFRYDGAYPALDSQSGDDFMLVEILLSVGRSAKVKRKILADMMAGLAADPGLDPEHVMVVFKEAQWENWAFGGGRLIHA